MIKNTLCAALAVLAILGATHAVAVEKSLPPVEVVANAPVTKGKLMLAKKKDHSKDAEKPAAKGKKAAKK